MNEIINNTSAVPAAVSINFLGERRFLAYQLRKQGMKFKDIARRLNVGAARAQHLFLSAQYRLNRKPHWSDGLSVRVSNCLNCCDINNREELLEAYKCGKLHAQSLWPPNYGWKSHKEVAKWLGLPEPHKPIKRLYFSSPKACPHCGGKLC